MEQKIYCFWEILSTWERKIELIGAIPRRCLQWFATDRGLILRWKEVQRAKYRYSTHICNTSSVSNQIFSFGIYLICQHYKTDFRNVTFSIAQFYFVTFCISSFSFIYNHHRSCGIFSKLHNLNFNGILWCDDITTQASLILLWRHVNNLTQMY